MPARPELVTTGIVVATHRDVYAVEGALRTAGIRLGRETVLPGVPQGATTRDIPGTVPIVVGGTARIDGRRVREVECWKKVMSEWPRPSLS